RPPRPTLFPYTTLFRSRLKGDETGPPSLPGNTALRRAYIEWLAHNVSGDLSRLKVLVDCANGAATAEAPELFQACRIQATFLNAKPDGQNINEGCGALHPENVAKPIREMQRQFDLGATSDRDADRALFSAARPRPATGPPLP